MLVQIFHDCWIEHSLIIDLHLKTIEEKKKSITEERSAPAEAYKDPLPKRYAIEVTYFSSPNHNIRTVIRNFPEPEDYQTVVKYLNKIARKVNSLKKKELSSEIGQLPEEK
jgi:viroplasmin and RNaseH domain-containing protein